MPSPSTTESTTEGATTSAEAKPPADVAAPSVSTKATSTETVRATEEEAATAAETQQSEVSTKSKTAVSPNIRPVSKDVSASTKESCPTEKKSASSSNSTITITSNITKAVAASSQQTPQGASKGGRSSLTTPLTPQTQTQQQHAGKKQQPFLCYAVRNGRNLSHCILFHKADMERLICPQVEYKVCWSIQEAVTYILSDDKLPSVWAKKSATVSMSTARAANASGASTSSSSAGTKRPWVDGTGSESHTKKGKAANGKNAYLTSWSTTKAPTIITKSTIWNQGGGTSNPTSPNPLAAAAEVGTTTIGSPWQARPIPKLAPTGIITSSSIWSGGNKGGGATMAKSFVTTGNKSVPTTILGGKRPTAAEVAQATAVRAIRASQRSFKRVKAANAAVAKSAARTATSLSTSTSTSAITSSSSSSKLPPQAAALVARNANKPKPILDYWDRMFYQLAHYKLKHKTFDNLTASSAGPLGTWAYRQRRFYQLAKADDLTEEKMQKKAKLIEIGFSFQRTATTKKFANQLSKDGEGPTDPKVHVADLEKNGIVMASWSSSPLKGKSPTKQSDQRWNDMFQELVEYKQENEGGFSTMTNNSSRLGKWASDQRKAFKQFKAGYPLTLPLTQERLQKLIEIGFDLVREPRLNHVQVFEKNFDKMFEQMKLIKDTTGSCLVRRQGSQIPLYDWVIRLRKEIAKIDKGIGSRLLDQEKIEQLHSIGFVTKKKLSWESQYQDLLKFHAAIGHTRVFLKGTESNPNLGKWVAKLRLMYRERNEGKENELTDERIQLLNELDFTWEAIKRTNPYPLPQERRTWEERFQELLHFEEQHGHLKVPQNLPGVGHWAHAQRKNYKLLKEGKKSPMTAQRALRLAEIGFELDTRPRNNKPDRYEQKM